MNRLAIFWIVLLLLPMALDAQRYETEVFTDVSVDLDVVYGSNYSALQTPFVLQDLKMDVYYPTHDTVGGTFYEAQRPLVLLFHAGSFLPKGPFLPFGDKQDSVMIEMGQQLAKRGFVAVSVDYRLGWNPLAGSQKDKAKSIITAVYRAVQDARACVRWFRKDADVDGNQYRIDPYKIVVGGTNSGGYVALGVGTFNKQAEINLLKFRDDVTGESLLDQSVLGGFFGEGGLEGNNVLNTPGYSSAVQCVLNMGGAVGDTSWIEAGEPPIVSFHGAADALTPFGTAVVIVSATGDPVVEVSGSRDIAKVQDRIGNNAIFEAAGFTDPVTTIANSKTPAYEGLFWFGDGFNQPAAFNGFEPWAWYDTNESAIIDAGNPSASFPPPYTGFGSAANPYASRAKAEVYLDTIMQYFIPRLLVALEPANIDSTAVETADPDDAVTGIADALAGKTTQVSIYPNPANNEINVGSTALIESVVVMDIAGREVAREELTSAANTKLDVASLNRGLYLVKVTLESGESTLSKVLLQ